MSRLTRKELNTYGFSEEQIKDLEDAGMSEYHLEDTLDLNSLDPRVACLMRVYFKCQLHGVEYKHNIYRKIAQVILDNGIIVHFIYNEVGALKSVLYVNDTIANGSLVYANKVEINTVCFSAYTHSDGRLVYRDVVETDDLEKDYLDLVQSVGVFNVHTDIAAIPLTKDLIFSELQPTLASVIDDRGNVGKRLVEIIESEMYGYYPVYIGGMLNVFRVYGESYFIINPEDDLVVKVIHKDRVFEYRYDDQQRITLVESTKDGVLGSIEKYQYLTEDSKLVSKVITLDGENEYITDMVFEYEAGHLVNIISQLDK